MRRYFFPRALKRAALNATGFSYEFLFEDGGVWGEILREIKVFNDLFVYPNIIFMGEFRCWGFTSLAFYNPEITVYHCAHFKYIFWGLTCMEIHFGWCCLQFQMY